MSAADWPVQVDPVFGCWVWTGKVNSTGYGIVWRGRRPQSAHVLVYEAERGPIPKGKTLDHWCKRRLCVNPWHLEAVSMGANHRAKSWRALCRRKTCQRGHSMETAMVTEAGGRVCRECSRGGA